MAANILESPALPDLPRATASFGLKVEGMSCASCVARIEKAIRRVPGVTEASVNLASGMATVTAHEADVDATVAAVREAGHPGR